MSTKKSDTLNHYVTTFSVAYTLFLVVTGVIANILPFDPGSGLSVAALVVSALHTGNSFISKNQRPMTKTERGSLSLYCLLASFLISLLLLVAVLSIFEGVEALVAIGSFISSLPLWLWLSVAALVVAVSYGILLLSFGWLSNRLFYRE